MRLHICILFCCLSEEGKLLSPCLAASRIVIYLIFHYVFKKRLKSLLRRKSEPVPYSQTFPRLISFTFIKLQWTWLGFSRVFYWFWWYFLKDSVSSAKKNKKTWEIDSSLWPLNVVLVKEAFQNTVHRSFSGTEERERERESLAFVFGTCSRFRASTGHEKQVKWHVNTLAWYKGV